MNHTIPTEHPSQPSAEQSSIDSVRWDRTWVFAPALVGAILAVICVLFRPAVPLVVGLWLAFGDGPHMAAAWARTYTDRQTRAERPILLLGSIVLSLFPVLMVAVAQGTRVPLLWDATLGVLGVLSVWHVARQHWGFVSIFRWRAGERDPSSLKWDRAVVRGASYLPWLYALTTHPTLRTIMQRPAQPSFIERLFAWATIAVWLGILLGYSLRLLPALRAQGLKAITTKHRYLATVAVVHSAAYFLLAGFEPLWHGAQTMDAALAVVTVWLSTFHAIEYIALCHYYLRNGAEHGAVDGTAASLGQHPRRYLALVLGFGVVFYCAMGLSTGVFPAIDPLGAVLVMNVPLSRWMLALFWSIAIHHYILDMRIWRVGSDPRLRRALSRE